MDFLVIVKVICYALNIAKLALQLAAKIRKAEKK